MSNCKMRSCSVQFPRHHGNTTCRNEKGLSKAHGRTRPPFKSGQAQPARSRELRFLRRGILNTSSERSGLIREGLAQIRLEILSECCACSGMEIEFGKASTAANFGCCRDDGRDCREDGSGNGGGCGNDGSGWHWGSGWENNGDEGNYWFCQGQACILFLLGLLNKHACSKVVLSALLLQLFLQRGLLANADAITSPSKQSVDGNAIAACAEKEDTCSSSNAQSEPDAIFEVQGGTWRRLLIDTDKDEFVVDPKKESDKDAFARDEQGQDHRNKSLQARGFDWTIKWCSDFVKNVLLPEGYPESVTGDYLDYTLWRMAQNIASQINGVLTTQALLYAVGLGKGAIPTAAAVNWVLKDGIGYLSKILLANYGRHFDVHPKGWRLLADLIENASHGLELLTPMYPHLFVYLGAAAGAGKSAAGLIQAATRSCFYAGFAAQRNFAEVIAKGEAQGMVSKSIGIALGIAISAYVGASGPTLVVTFLTVTGVHMFCNLKSYQAVQLRTLNPYRACLVFGEYIRGGVVASVEEVNAAEPIFIEIPFLLFKHTKLKESTGNLLSLETKKDAAIIASKLNLGVSLPNVIRSQSEADELFKIYQDEQYVLAERQNTYQALLKEGATSHDLLKLMLQVCYLHQLQTGHAERSLDFYVSSPIEISYRLAVDKFDLVQKQLSSAGWSLSDGLVARPLPYRLLSVSG